MKTSPRTTKDRATTANVRSDPGAPGITVGFQLSRYRRNIYKYSLKRMIYFRIDYVIVNKKCMYKGKD